MTQSAKLGKLALGFGLFGILFLSGCTSLPLTVSVDPSSKAASEAFSEVPPEPMDLPVLSDPAYSALREALAALPGFLGLVPDTDGAQVLRAVLQGTAPALPPLLPSTPQGWTLEVVGGAELRRQRLQVPDVKLPERTDAAPIPSDAIGLGPGSPLLITIPGDGTFICTAAFVFHANHNYYLSTAGHCLLPFWADATHGTGSLYNPSAVSASVCVATCVFGGFLTGEMGDFRALGPVGFARQSMGGADVGNDFGLIQIPKSLYTVIRPALPTWGGPTGENGDEGFATPIVQYGNGVHQGTFFTTKGRHGLSNDDGATSSYSVFMHTAGGDSGSGVAHAAPRLNTDVYGGSEALGVHTHGTYLVRFTGAEGLPIVFGTSITNAKLMALAAGLTLELVKEGDAILLNELPVAAATASCRDRDCTFDGRASSDSDGSIASYGWDFGDGMTGTGPLVAHTFGADGTYDVALTVTDDGGATDTQTLTVTVTAPANLLPSASFTSTCSGRACSFDGRASSDSDGRVVGYAWDFGDGETGTGATPSHTYATAGTYTVILTVTDDDDGTGQASRSLTVTSISLAAKGYKVKGVNTVDLTWSGAAGTNVNLLRGGSALATTPNDGAYTDSTGTKGKATYTYQVCETSTSTCSNTVTVKF